MKYLFSIQPRFPTILVIALVTDNELLMIQNSYFISK